MKKFLGIVLVLCLITTSTGYFYIKSLVLPLNQSDKTTKTFVVEKGQGFAVTAQKLTDEKLIKSPWSLKIAAYFSSNKGKNIQAGNFQLSPSMSPTEMLEVLGHGRADVLIVTLIEGLRREEIASALGLTFKNNNLVFNEKQFLDITQKDEGYLFPDTYELALDSNAQSVAAILKNTLNKKISPRLTSDIKESGHSLHEILTMASLIEREARTSESRKMVSGILWNRIKNNWPLQVDATLQYSKGYDKVSKDWWKSPLGIDKDIISPYNTYKNTGLPPGPICNPSLSSIEAAVYPKESSFWYYITDNDGNMHYAETIEQHNQNVNKYLR